MTGGHVAAAAQVAVRTYAVFYEIMSSNIAGTFVTGRRSPRNSKTRSKGSAGTPGRLHGEIATWSWPCTHLDGQARTADEGGFRSPVRRQRCVKGAMRRVDIPGGGRDRAHGSFAGADHGDDLAAALLRLHTAAIE